MFNGKFSPWLGTGNVAVVGAAIDGELGTFFKSWLWFALCGLGPRHLTSLSLLPPPPGVKGNWVRRSGCEGMGTVSLNGFSEGAMKGSTFLWGSQKHHGSWN